MAALVAARRRATPSLLRAIKPRGATTTKTAAFLSSRAWEGRSEGGGGGSGTSGAEEGWRSRLLATAAAGLALAVGVGVGVPGDGAKNCGIVGVVSSNEKGSAVDAVDFLVEVRGMLLFLSFCPVV